MTESSEDDLDVDVKDQREIPEIGQLLERELSDGRKVFLMVGDVNNDGDIDQDDLEILQLLATESSLSDFLQSKLGEEELLACDINGDGVVDVHDLIQLTRTVIGNLEVISLTDDLTGLENRRGLRIRIKEKIAAVRRFQHEMTCLAIDIDFFKQINDQHGHYAGDKILKELASILNSCVREADIVARVGGEEFVVILDQASLVNAVIIAEKIRRLVESHMVKLEDAVANFTVSIGVADFCRDMTLQCLLNDADKALYRAKAGGRNRVECFDRQ